MTLLTCMVCGYDKLRGEESREKHMARLHKKAGKVKAAEKVLAAAPEKAAPATSVVAIKESMQKEEQRRAAAKLVKKPRDPATLPTAPWRGVFTWDCDAKTEEDARVLFKEVLKELKAHGLTRPNLVEVMALW